ncbi:MAG: aspartate/glutamate racemase family protein [Clostridia bacterium]|nr:aspartate/glutamate racemase family protein [Clostridia bacterium]
MIGIFDSGRGGENAARYLYSLLPSETVMLLCDRENAPFGSRTEGELIPILRAGLSRLRSLGAERILVACCTMCTVLPALAGEFPEAFPIIGPTAAEAVRSGGRIAVISTERTARSHAFREALLGRLPDARILELPAPALVGIAERGGAALPEEYAEIDSVLHTVSLFGADTLILGCTHFSTLKDYIAASLPDTALVDAAKVGAVALAEEIKQLRENKRRLKKWQNTDADGLTRRWQTSLP